MSGSTPVPESLVRLRQEIESVDRSIVLLLAARLDAANRALRMRAGRDGRMTDAQQERRVLRRSRAWARELGLPEKLVETLFRTLIEEGKARYRRGETSVEALPFVTLLMAAPDGSASDLGNVTNPQLAAVSAPR